MRVARLLVAAGLFAFVKPLAAQEPAPTAMLAPGDTLRMTLGDALRRAQPASEQITIFEQQLTRARADKTTAVSDLLPQVTLTPTYSNIIETPFRQFFDQSGAGENPFTVRNTWRVGGNAVWTPINFAAYSQIEGASRGIDLARLQLSQQEAYTILTVAASYYNAILADQLLSIRLATLEQAERTFKEIQLGYEVGTQSEFDALRARVARDNQVPAVTEARATRAITFTQLKQLLDLPIDRELDLVTSLDEVTTMPTLPDTISQRLGVADTASDRRNVVQQAEVSVQQARAFYDAAGRQWLPTVYGFVNYDKAGFGSSFWPSSGGWFDDFNAGFGLNFPLFTGGRILGQRRAARADLEIAEQSLKLTREQAALDNVSITSRLREAEDNAQATQAVVEQAQRAYEIAELRFREGLSTQTELQDVRIQLEEARANRASAFRDLQVARLRLVLLPYLPIGTADPSIVNAGISTRAATGSASSSITAPSASRR
jgi:outer membrane protein TolC